MNSRTKNAKRGPVIMPVEPPYEFLRWMANSPLLLSASDEVECRKNYATGREVMKAALEGRNRK